jgi:hypothetical protein
MNFNPFATGNVLGPQKPVNPGGQVENRGRGANGVPIDPVTGQPVDGDTQMQNDFLYGGSPGAAQRFNQQTAGIASRYGGSLGNIADSYAPQLTARSAQLGNQVSDLSEGAYGQGNALLGSGANALNANPDAYLDTGSLMASKQQAGNVAGAADRLMNMSFDGPSAAEAQLNAGAQQTAAQNVALASSGRGMGGSAAARRAAMGQNAQVMGQTNAADAVLRANEEATRKQEAMQAAGAAGGLYGNAAGIDQGNLAAVANARNAAVGNANQLGLGLANAGVSALGQGISGANAGANTQLGAMMNAGQLALGATGQAASTELAGQQLQNQTNMNALQGTEAYEGNLLGQRGQSMGAQATNQANAQANQQTMLNAVTSTAGTGIGAAALLSDRRAKKDIVPLAGGSDADRFRAQLDDFRGQFGLGGGPSPAAAQDAVRNAPAYAFRYKDPERHGEGQRVGVMAQDLETTPAGAAAVMRSPDGTRMVDTGELSTINTAALHGQQTQLDDTMARLDEIEKRIKARDAGFVTPKPPNTDDLDWAYGREASAPR